MEENQDIEQAEVALKTTPKSTIPSWLRLATAAFSAIAGLMYLLAALVFFAIYTIGKTSSSMSDEQLAQRIANMVEADTTEEKATAVLKAQIYAVEQLGTLFPVQMAFIGCLSLLLIISGIGLLWKTGWSIPLGRLSCILMLVTTAVVFILNKEAASNILEKSNEMVPSEDYQPLSWLTILRYVFLCSMCPIALIISYGMLVKQYATNKLIAEEGK